MSLLNKLLPASAQARVQAVATSRRTRKWGLGILIFVVLFGLIGFFALPPVIHPQAEKQLSKLLSRPVTIGKVSLNPYTLRLEIDQLHIGERSADTPFVDVRTFIVQASWGSLFRLKPVIGEVYMDAPQVHIVRNDAQSFNFSDLVEQFSKPSAEPPPKPGKPLLFAVHNIHIDNGLIDFQDHLLQQHHVIDQFQFGIPFLANLPSKVDTFVQPFLQARIDGSALQVNGQTKPFNGTFNSDIVVKLDQLDLSQLLSYSPAKLPVLLPSGKLSTNLDLQFAMKEQKPTVQISGTVALDQISLTDAAKQPLFDVAALHIGAIDVEPLHGVIHLSELSIDKPVLNVSRDRAGALNFSKLAASQPSKPAAAAPAPAPAAAPEKPAPLDFSLQKLALNDGAVHFSDQSTAPAASLGIQQLSVSASNVSTLAHQPAQYEVHLASDHGGTISSKGSFTLADSKLAADASIEQLALPMIQPYLAQALSARLDRGNLGLTLSAAVDWSAAPAKINVGPGVLSLDGLRILADKQAKPVAELAHAAAHIERVDVGAHHAELSSVELEGLALDAERGADGAINLTQLVRSSPPTRRAPPRPAAGAAPEAPWTYSIAAVELGKSNITYGDRSTAQPVTLSLSSLQIKLQHVSNDLGKPIELDLSSGFQQKGQLKVHGTVAPQPLKLALQLEGRQLDVAALEPYFAANLNATIASALVGLKGELKLAQEGKALKVHYQGDAGVYQVRMLDKLTSDQFAGWRSLKLTQIKAAYSNTGTDVNVGQITLSEFYGKVLLNSNGRLNLSDFATQQNAPATSLTRAEPAAPGAAPAPAPSPTPTPAPTPAAPDNTAAAAPPVKLNFGHILLHQGKVDYTDNFIKPNFSAHLVSIEGDIGAFGTDSTTPAPIAVQAQLNDNGPVSISGTANPLIKPPFLDLTATTRDVELTNFSAYSIKYAGYPIVKGKLNVDLHYQVDKGQLNANNHIFIDQFTFGDHVDSPSATNLPVRLAISLLKNSRGEIDVNIPVSGSLNDPQISVGSLIWHAFLNLLEKAVTSPFSLLGSAFGGSDELGYVAFQPGSAALSDAETKKLDTLVKALNDRTGIKLDLAGRVDPALDTPGLKQQALERQVKREKLKDVVGKGQSIDIDSVQVAPDEYNKYLERAYSDASIKNKPRNLIGIAKSQTPDEMKKLMLDATTVSEADLTALAQQRAAVAQQWFQGKIDPSRIFLTAPKMDASGISDKGPSTRVEFTLK
jgi:hypothetical protein